MSPRCRVRATPREQALALPGDELIPNAIDTLTHAVTVAGARNELWPWLAQMGADRAGWYSYDWVDNGGRRSAQSDPVRAAGSTGRHDLSGTPRVQGRVCSHRKGNQSLAGARMAVCERRVSGDVGIRAEGRRRRMSRASSCVRAPVRHTGSRGFLRQWDSGWRGWCTFSCSGSSCSESLACRSGLRREGIMSVKRRAMVEPHAERPLLWPSRPRATPHMSVRPGSATAVHGNPRCWTSRRPARSLHAEVRHRRVPSHRGGRPGRHHVCRVDGHGSGGLGHRPRDLQGSARSSWVPTPTAMCGCTASSPSRKRWDGECWLTAGSRNGDGRSDAAVGSQRRLPRPPAGRVRGVQRARLREDRLDTARRCQRAAPIDRPNRNACGCDRRRSRGGSSAGTGRAFLLASSSIRRVSMRLVKNEAERRAQVVGQS